ncbi:peptidase [Paenibacillus sp. M1]|uniref:Peptidase n=1 Tax=Paenibacillus haidiansis TaxID=1574488 RepID=A0ABU7VVA8_9BACL
MKKMNKAIAAASLLAMAAIPTAAFAQNLNVTPLPAASSDTALVQDQVKVVPGTLGLITDFVNDQSGKFITVTGRGLAPADQSEIILSITKDTKIVDAKGNKVALQTIIDEKKAVKAFYGPNITKSLPARGTALTLVVQDTSFTAVDGTVSEVRDNGIFVKGTNVYSGFEDSIVLHFADTTKLVDRNGQSVAAADIQTGATVRAFYGPAVMMSFPAQATASYVIVDTENAVAPNEEAPGTNGVIAKLSDNLITVIGNPLEQGGMNYIHLTVDDKTEIVDESGAALTKDALKSDARIKAYYPEMMTMIYPPRSHADKIVVLKEELPKIEGTVQASDLASDGKVYINVGSDASTDNDVILNISDETVIIPSLGQDTALQPGMKIVAYHSPIMTRSLPGMTHAEFIIASDIVADDPTPVTIEKVQPAL